MKIYILLLFSISLFSAFENIDYSAQSLSMGNSFISIPAGVYSSFYNPALISFTSEPQVTLTYGLPQMNLWDKSTITNLNAAFGYPLPGFNLSILYSSLSLFGIYSEEFIGLNISRKLFKISSVGISVKFFSLRYIIDEYYERDIVFQTGTYKRTTDIDLGVAVKLGSVGIGLIGKNLLNSKIGFLDKEATINPTFGIGLNYSEKNFLIACDITRKYSKSPDTTLSLGLEKRIINGKFALRTGFITNITSESRERKDLTAGLGLNIKNISLDYGFKYSLYGLKNLYGTHLLTFSLKFKPREQVVSETPKRPQVTITTPAEPIKVPEISTPTITVEPIKIPEIPTPTVIVEPAKMPEISTPTVTTAPIQKPEIPDIAVKISTEPQIQELILPQQELLTEIPTPTTPPAVSTITQPTEIIIEETEILTKPPAVESVVAPEPKIEIAPVEKIKKQKFPIVYRTLPGDTLRSLAKKFYGDARLWEKIYMANKEKLPKGILLPNLDIIIP